MLIYYLIFILIGIVSATIIKSRRVSRNAKVLEEYEKNQPKFDFYRILPFSVEALKIEHTQNGLRTLSFTPISVKQIDEDVYSIYVKSTYESKIVEFELFIYDKIMIDEEDNTHKYSMALLHTERPGSDNLIKILAKLFQVEINASAQITRETVLFSQPQSINIDLLFQPFNRTLFFASNAKVYPSACLNIEFDLNKGFFKISEVDAIYRPIIIEHLLFRRNIKNPAKPDQQ